MRLAKAFFSGLVILGWFAWPGILLAQPASEAVVRSYQGKGVVLEVKPDTAVVVIRHEAISNYMDAMTMPFKVKTPGILDGLKRGDQVFFRLNVTEEESWISDIVKTGEVPLRPEVSARPAAGGAKISLLDYKLTNELGRAVSLNDFRGQAIAITFFYTRCPLPDYCPRLSRNFQEASRKMEQMTNLPPRWHFISISFDPQFDTPPVLRNYGESYHYDPAHWSFLTGPAEKVAALAHAAGVEYAAENGTINHNFRTLIVDPQSHLQMVFPVSGDLSDQIVSEMMKALKATNGQKNENRQN
jgi:protein SCO1